MSIIEIVPIGTNEATMLQNISKQTFFETFAPHNAPENMESYMATGFELPKLENELKCTQSFFYFAKWEGQIAGYLKLNIDAAQTELKDPAALEIERIYVLQAYQANKIGQSLFTKALEIAKEKSKQYVWLGVWEKNEKAIGFYKKNGFQIFDQHEFVLGSEVQIDIMMRLAV